MPAPPPPAPRSAPSGAYAELWCQSAFSFLEGASMPEELAHQAAALGLSALGVCDRDGVYGLVRAWKTAQQHPGLELLHGALLTLGQREPEQRVALYAMDEAGWHSLCELISRAQADQPKGEALLAPQELLQRNMGLVALIGPEWDDSPHAGPLADALGDRLYLAASRQLLPSDGPRHRAIERLTRRLGRPALACNRPLTHHPDRQPLQDVLTCIRHKTTLDQAGTLLQPNAERHLKTPAAMASLFADRPAWIRRTLEVAERCRFRLDQLRYDYPREVVPEGLSPMEHLRDLVEEGMRWRWPEGPSPAMRAQVEHELALIEELDFPAYFLTVYDIVRFARDRGILCQGRGSAANSVVCFALGVTSVDPSQQRLLFERFISKERGEPPDIDVDFEHERREEVLQYVYGKYGRHRAGMVNEIISYKARSAIRDVGKAVGLSLDQVDRLARNTDRWSRGEPDPERVVEIGVDPADRRVRLAMALCEEIHGLPRHLSIHVGGFVISEQPLRERCPIEPAAMDDRTVIQWDKDDIDAVDFVKVDCLSLGMLTAIRKCFELVEAHHGRPLTLATVPRGDPFVYDMICAADTMGVFQIESRAQMSMLPRLRPRSFYDLVVEVALVRPGPIQGGMVHPYLARRSGEQPVVYAHPKLEPILERTMGVPIFQEQVMEMAMAVGGFSPGEADELRRAMGAWRKRGGLERLVKRLITNMQEEGLSLDYAKQIAKQILGFGEYGFPESHAASFALLVWVSCYLKRYYPAAFTAALLNAQPMGFYGPRNLVDGARRHGVEVRAVDVSVSRWDNSLEETGRADPLEGGRDGVIARGVALRLGLRQIHGLGEDAALRIGAARAEAPLRGIADLARRAKLDRGDLLALARADALSCFGMNRRQAAWAVEGLWSRSLPLLEGLSPDDDDAPLPRASPYEELQLDYLATSLSLDRHPVGLARAELDREDVLRAADLAHMDDGDPVCVAGLVVNRQRPPNASGVVFMTLEDETGMVSVVVWSRIFEAQRRVIVGEKLLKVEGTLQKDTDAVSLLADRFEPLGLGDVRAKSRDFH